MTKFNFFQHKMDKCHNILAFILILTNLILIRNNFKTNENELNNKISQEKANKLLIDYSILLKNASQTIGQLECEKSKNEVSKSGGWCSNISGLNSSQHLCDKELAKELSNFLASKTVASFGDGPGAYKQIINELNQVSCYDAFDGAPYVELTTNNNVNYIDLSKPIYHLNQYDWIISLEVAEHIPSQFESVYLDNLVRHAKEGIILSWATIGQSGHSHVNNRHFNYVKEQMQARNFIHNQEESEFFKSKSTLSWLKSNLNVYRKI